MWALKGSSQLAVGNTSTLKSWAHLAIHPLPSMLWSPHKNVVTSERCNHKIWFPYKDVVSSQRHGDLTKMWSPYHLTQIWSPHKDAVTSQRFSTSQRCDHKGMVIKMWSPYKGVVTLQMCGHPTKLWSCFKDVTL